MTCAEITQKRAERSQILLKLYSNSILRNVREVSRLASGFDRRIEVASNRIVYTNVYLKLELGSLNSWLI